MNRAMQLKGKVTFAGMFIMMGITDRHMPLHEQGGFADRMAKIIADIRADLGEPNLPGPAHRLRGDRHRHARPRPPTSPAGSAR